MFSSFFSISRPVQRCCVGAVLGVSIAFAFWSGLSQADAPTDQYTVTADTVQDNFTGLVWQRVAPNQTFTQANAVAFCNDLTLAGASDWRLPHIQELLSIVDRTRGSPAVDPTAFPNTPRDFPNTPREFFWSSTPVSGIASQAWTVFFSEGVDIANGVNNANRVRCVR